MEKTYNINYLRYDNLSDAGAEIRELVEQARKACEGAYAPYSGFRVGAAARLESGTVVTASNQESEVFPAGVCAEKNLLSYYQAHFAHDPIVDFAVVSIPGIRECYPCGLCRQTLVDTESRQRRPFRVIMASDNSATVVASAHSLMPFTFKL